MTISLSKLAELARFADSSDLTSVFLESDTFAGRHMRKAATEALPVLLNIANAAVLYMAANDDQTTHGDEYHRNRAHANDALRAALAKVTP